MRHSQSPLRSLLLFVAFSALAACSVRDAACGRPGRQTASADASGAATPAGSAAAAAGGSTASGGMKIVFLGDSLTAGYGLTSQESFPSRLQEKFEAEGYDEVETVNAGISGDTTAGGLRRLEQALEDGTRILVVGLGGNDALRGLSTTQTSQNLAAIIQGATAKRATVVLAGMLAPTNYGADYQERFAAVFPDLARAYVKNVTYVPFLLEGVAGNPALNQADGIHPNAEGTKVIAEMLYPKLRALVDALTSGGGGGA